MKHGAKVTLIFQTAKIGVGCLRIENVINTYLYAQCVIQKHTLVGKVKAIISLLVCIASNGMSNYATVKGKCSDVLPI